MKRGSFHCLLLLFICSRSYLFPNKWGFDRKVLVLKGLHSQNRFEEKDPEVFRAITNEWKRQRRGLELIASENYVSTPVLSALGSCLTNKYSEGYPNSRYYAGNLIIDEIETLCQRRALELFSLNGSEWGVNVQAYSGSPANFAVYTALLKPHDLIMGLDLRSGGHLSHGYQTTTRKVSASSLFFESIPYKVNPETELIDYDYMEEIVFRWKPKILIAGASSYSRDWDYCRMRKIANLVNAYLMADISHIAGIVATKFCNNPFPFCDVVTTTTHKSLRGPRSAIIFAKSQLIPSINQAVFPGLQGGPHNNQIAATAVALREARSKSFNDYINQTLKNSKALAEAFKKESFRIITNGTDNHLFVWDIRNTLVNERLSAAKFEKVLDFCGISTNKNYIPSDSSMKPHGIRIGLLAMTSRGMKETDMAQIAKFFMQVYQLLRHFPLSAKDQKLQDFIFALHKNEEYEFIRHELQKIKEQIELFVESYEIPGQSYLQD